MSKNSSLAIIPARGGSKAVIVAVVQVRLGSTRLAKKAFKMILGKPILALLIDRIKYCKLIDKIVIATTTQDNEILEFAANYGIDAYAGSEMDIVGRMYQTAKKFKAAAVVRITGDCPLVDPELVDEIVQIYLNDPSIDYMSNALVPTYPHGLDIELTPLRILEFLWRNLEDPLFREWPGGFMIKNSDKFKVVNKRNDNDLSSHRWTLDYEEDYRLISKIYEKLGPNLEMFYMRDILALLEREPDLLKINAMHHVRNIGYLSNDVFREITSSVKNDGGVLNA